jgi:hypothetical protein
VKFTMSGAPVIARDLQDLPAEARTAVAIPEGWEAIAALCRRIDQPALVGLTVDRIVAEIPAYASSEVPPADLYASVDHNLEMILFGVMAHRGPTPQELEVRRELGHRRALQALPVEALLSAYHVGFRELWAELVRQAENDGNATGLLLSAATTTWSWIHEVTEAVANSYRQTVTLREAAAQGTRQRLLEMMLLGDTESAEARSLTEAAGFDPQRSFTAVAIAIDVADSLSPADFEERLARVAGLQRLGMRGRSVVLLAQDKDDSQLGLGLRGAFNNAVGIGLRRPGLAGARESIFDAERAMGVAANGSGFAMFVDCWPAATARQERHRLEPVIARSVSAITSNPTLAESVRAFADSGFSLTGAARALHVHPNTLAYRLDRWERLTGWNPRTWEGLEKSMVCLELSTTSSQT